MIPIVLYDDRRARRFEPFASTRPVSEMVAGVMPIRARWAVVLQVSGDSRFAAGSRHADFDEPSAGVVVRGTIPRGSIIVNSRAVPVLPDDFARAARRAASCTMWRCGDQLAAVRLGEALDAAVFDDGTVTLDELHAGTGGIGDVGGWWLEDVWDVIRFLPEMLTSDISAIVQRLEVPSRTALRPPAHTTVIGNEPAVALAAGDGAPEKATVIEPHVVLDTSGGPILIDSGAHIHAFTRINGPCYIGRAVNVMGGDVSTCSVGEVSKVRGELSNTVVAGYSNKGHDGFVGHSYLGRWVNLGAGTVTSNLKNTYGSVALWTPDGVRDSGMQFLGTLFGDHVKTGIGLRLTTGTVLGAGSNVFGNMPPKVVAPFSWGDSPPYSLYHADKFLETAARMMARRHVELSDRARRHLSAVHEGRWTLEYRES